MIVKSLYLKRQPNSYDFGKAIFPNHIQSIEDRRKYFNDHPDKIKLSKKNVVDLFCRALVEAIDPAYIERWERVTKKNMLEWLTNKNRRFRVCLFVALFNCMIENKTTFKKLSNDRCVRSSSIKEIELYYCKRIRAERKKEDKQATRTMPVFTKKDMAVYNKIKAANRECMIKREVEKCINDYVKDMKSITTAPSDYVRYLCIHHHKIIEKAITEAVDEFDKWCYDKHWQDYYAIEHLVIPFHRIGNRLIEYEKREGLK